MFIYRWYFVRHSSTLLRQSARRSYWTSGLLYFRREITATIVSSLLAQLSLHFRAGITIIIFFIASDIPLRYLFNTSLRTSAFKIRITRIEKKKPNSYKSEIVIYTYYTRRSSQTSPCRCPTSNSSGSKSAWRQSPVWRTSYRWKSRSTDTCTSRWSRTETWPRLGTIFSRWPTWSGTISLLDGYERNNTITTPIQRYLRGKCIVFSDLFVPSHDLDLNVSTVDTICIFLRVF